MGGLGARGLVVMAARNSLPQIRGQISLKSLLLAVLLYASAGQKAFSFRTLLYRPL